MKLQRILLAVIVALFATTAMAERKSKTFICHVGNEEGPGGEVFLDDPGCVPVEENGYFCPDAGKIDLIEVANANKHLNNPSHAWDEVSDYLPADKGATGVGDTDTDGNGIDEGCEIPVVECPCAVEGGEVQAAWLGTLDEIASSPGSIIDNSCSSGTFRYVNAITDEREILTVATSRLGTGMACTTVDSDGTFRFIQIAGSGSTMDFYYNACATIINDAVGLDPNTGEDCLID